MPMKAIFKITWPNGKIYAGSDLIDSISYFGSPSEAAILADHPTPISRRDISIRKEILYESDSATDTEIRKKEIEFILQLRANDPSIGYNGLPKFRP